MIIKHTKSVPGTGDDGMRKSYVITTECGASFTVEPLRSNMWQCEDLEFASLRAVKAWVVDTHVEGEMSEEEYESTLDVVEGLWATVCPACLYLATVDYIVGSASLEAMPLDMLDKHGLLLPDGTPNVKYAKEQVALARKNYKD